MVGEVKFLGTTLTKQNSIQEDNHSTLQSRDAYCHSPTTGTCACARQQQAIRDRDKFVVFSATTKPRIYLGHGWLAAPAAIFGRTPGAVPTNFRLCRNIRTNLFISIFFVFNRLMSDSGEISILPISCNQHSTQWIVCVTNWVHKAVKTYYQTLTM
jgi:hypothetical protein